MSRQVTFDYSKAGSFISEEEIGYMKKLTLDAKETLVSKTGAGNDFLGWIDLPVDYDKEEFARIKAAAAKIREDSAIPTFCWLSVSVVLIWEPERLSSS